jgi:ATP-binding cassette subfamily B multidrug efflux pump
VKELAYVNKYFLRYRWHLLGGIVFVSLSNYFRILQPQMIREALDLVVDNIGLYQAFAGFAPQAAFFQYLGRNLLLFALLVLLFAFLMGVFMYFMRQTINVMSRLIEYDMRKAIYDHYQRLDLAFYKRNTTGDMMARLTEDVSKVRNYVGPAVLYGINLVSLFALVIYSMLRVNVTLSLYCLAPLPILSLSIYYVSDLINKKSEPIQRQLAYLNSIAQEVYSGIRVVKSYVQEGPMARFFAGQSEDYKGKSMSLAKVNAGFYPLMILLIGASTIIVVYIGGLQVARGVITPGNIAEFVIYVNMLTWPVTAIGWIASIVQQAAASQKRLNEFLDTPPAVRSPKVDPRPLRGHIVFDRVSFTYPDTGITALREVSFELLPGQKMAVIGRTGSGKSTIADLLARMYDPTSGSIRLDGEDMREIDLHNLRRRLGYVPQDVFLFSDTVANNIAFGVADADREAIKAAARHAAVHDDIAALSEGYETVVGERGVTLSGGQKQRVSIARAFLKAPDILLLDDCLSAVDTGTEKQILAYFNEALADKTAIVITHRIYGLLEFDKIIVLDNGAVVEIGAHEQLLAKKGYYYDLFERQSMENGEE